MANSIDMGRRTLFQAIPALALTATAAQALKMPDAPVSDLPDWWKKLTDVIADLESPDRCEMHISIAAKAFAANEIRKAMGLPEADNPDIREYHAVTDFYIMNGRKNPVRGVN